MVVHGDDSLNEKSEGRIELEHKISKEFKEPSREQLIATGELDENEGLDGEELQEENASLADEEPEVVEGEIEQPVSTTPAIVPSHEPSIRKQIEQGLMAGKTRDELVSMGFNKRSIQTVASELKTKMGSNKPVGRGIPQGRVGTQIFAKGSPPEAIIDSIVMPDVSNGHGPSFEQGMKFGLSIITLAIRMTQELSAIGIQQTKPLIEAAREMRSGEEAAAKNAAGEAAMEAAGLVSEKLMPVIAAMSKGGGGGTTDPMKAMMVRQMEPILQSMMQGMMGILPGAKQPPQLNQSNPQPTAGWEHSEE